MCAKVLQETDMAGIPHLKLMLCVYNLEFHFNFLYNRWLNTKLRQIIYASTLKIKKTGDTFKWTDTREYKVKK
jgi:hypothetical protein